MVAGGAGMRISRRKTVASSIALPSVARPGMAGKITRRGRASPPRGVTGPLRRRHDRGMDLPAPLAWLLDDAAAIRGPDRFLAELGGRLAADGVPLAGGALTLAVPHPIVARRTWLWRAETGAVIEALGFAGMALPADGKPGQAGRDWLAGLGPVLEDAAGPAALGWAGTRAFDAAESGRLRQAARFAAAPLAALASRAALAAL